MIWLVWEEGGHEGIEVPSKLRMDSAFLALSWEEPNGSVVNIMELYRVKGKLFSNHFATWEEESGLLVPTPNIWERRASLTGIALTVTTNLWTFFNARDAETKEYSGMIPDILSSLRETANFSIDWTIPPDGMYGALENGTWNGLVGMVLRGEADLAAAGLAVTHERSNAVDFAFAFIESHATLITLDPAYLGAEREINITSFLDVFTPASWTLIAVIMVLSFFTFQVQLLSSNGAPQRNFAQSVATSVGFVYKSMLQLDFPSSMMGETLSGKILFMSTSFCSIVTIAYYEGMLTSFMTANTPAPSIMSFSDAVQLGYQVITMEGSKHATDLESAPQGSGRNLAYMTMKGNPKFYYPSFNSLADALLSNPRYIVANSEFSFAGDSRFLPLINLNDANIDPVGLAFPKDSEFLDYFNYNMIKLHQHGVMDFLIKKWLHSREPDDVCVCNQVEEAATLGYSNLLLPVVILAAGVVSVSLMLLFERGTKCLFG